MIHDFERDGLRPAIRPRPKRRPWQFSVWQLMKWTFGACCFFGAVAVMNRAVGDAREAARRSECLGHVCQLQLALLNYHDTYGTLPPAYVADSIGRPMHSWRVLVLPFIDEAALYKRYDFTEPWNGPKNIALLNSMPAIFACPTRSEGPTTLTSFAAITGPGTMFPGTRPVKFGDVSDGPANTALFAEVANVDIPWTAPIDLDARHMSFIINDPTTPGISSKHPFGAHISLGERRYFLHNRFGPETLRALITIAGGEGIKADEVFDSN